MSNSNRWLPATFNTSSSQRKSVRRRGFFGWLFAATATTLLCGGNVAHSGPCTAQIAQLERQIQRSLVDPDSGPTAPQTIEAQLHHQPTPVAVQNAESQARADTDGALQRAQKADTDGDAAACIVALEETKHRWVGPARLAFDGALPSRPEFRPQGITTRAAVSFHVRKTSSSLSGTAPRPHQKHYLEGLVS
jgi:hypothetical protein